jgi:hypothetical protein
MTDAVSILKTYPSTKIPLQNLKMHKNKMMLKKQRFVRKSEHFSKIRSSLELALQEVALSSFATKRWIKLCLSYFEFISPSERSREPARLMNLLSEHSDGLTRVEMLALFYETYLEASLQRQESYRVCLEKIIQRARAMFSKYDLTIFYCKQTKRYFIQVLFVKK